MRAQYVGRPPSALIVTEIGPTPSSKTIDVLAPSSATSPIDASTNAAPSVGCPANGSSVPGVKIRSFLVCAGSSGGNTNTVSERLSSRAIACISRASRPSAAGKTAS